MKLNKWTRRFALMLAGLGLLAIVFYFAIQKYTRHRVIATLEEIVGGPVEIEEIRIGRDTIELRGIRASESKADEAPWLTIDQAILGLKLGDAIGGETVPESASLRGASLILRFNEQGRLVSDFTTRWQAVQERLKQLDIADARAEIFQQGRAPLIVERIDAKLRVTGDELHVRGTGDTLDAHWNLDTRTDRASLATDCELSTNRLRLSTDQFATLPLVPRFGHDVRASGMTPVLLVLRIDEQGDLTYRLELSPTMLSLELASASLSVTNVEGDIVAQNDLVTFSGLRGRVSGGRFSGGGQARRQGEIWIGQVEGKIEGVPSTGLPKAWRVPEAVSGIISGEGDINFEFADTYVDLRGAASAVVDRARVRGIQSRPLAIGVDLRKLRKNAGADPITLDGTATVVVDVPDADLVELLKAAEFDASELEDLSGRIGFQADVQIPLATIRDPATSQAKGRLTSGNMQFRGIPLSDVRGSFNFEDGVASIDDLNTKIAETGKLRGSLRIQVQPLGDIAAELGFESLPAALIEKLVSQPMESLTGDVSCDVRASAPVPDWKNLDVWQASGRVQSDVLSLDRHRLEQVLASFDLRQGRLSVVNGSARWNDASVEAKGELQLRPPCAYRLAASASDIDVETVAELTEFEMPFEISGRASVDATAVGELDPWTWNATGDLRLSNLMVAKLDVDSPVAKWRASNNHLKVTEAEARILGGTVQLAAEFPFHDERPSSVTGTFSGFDAQRLRQHLPETPLDVSGTAAGAFTLTGIENLDSASGTLQLRDVSGEVYGVPVDNLSVDVSLLEQNIELEAKGMAMGGTVSLTTSALVKELRRENMAIAARVSASGVQLSQAWQVLGRQVQVEPPAGVAEVQLELEFRGSAFKPTGAGQLVLNDVRWKSKQLATQLTSNVDVLHDSVVLRDLTFDYGRGKISSTVEFRLDELGSGTYVLVAERVALRDLLDTYPEFAHDARGTVDAGFRGRFANLRIDGSGRVRVSSGGMAGIPLRKIDSSVHWAFDIPSRRGKAEIRLTRGEVLHGRATGDASLAWGRQLTLNGKVSFANLDLRAVAGTTNLVSDQLSGRLSGNVSFQGRNVRSLADISGTYDLRVANSQLLRVPVLSELTRATGIGTPSTTFSDTEIKGRMNRGIIRVDRMTMVAASIHMFLQGTITTRGQLDLDVTADTAELLAIGVVTGFLRPTDWLRRRLIFLHVGGTVRSPVVLPQTEKFIQQEVLLFFLPFGPA